MTEPDSAGNPASPATWQDVVRQHISGPVFSLAFHIIVLVLLGTLVVIVPNAGKDDIEPVQIAELEPVLPPPEEEPTPSDMTVMDTSSPALDRYESNLQQMEDVGVNDVEIMTDIDIPTPLAIPNSNSALKLQGVLPFGHRGGGEMGDGGEGDGRGNTIGELQGVFYDLKQTRGRQTSEEFRGVPTAPPPNQDGSKPTNWLAERVGPTFEIMQSFVNGPWRREYDAQGRVHYPALDKYYSSPTRLWTSLFYTEREINAELAPKYYECDDVVKVPGAWVCIYSGNVVAPFSGKFRFLGTADDVILVRFNKEIVLDYGFASMTAASFFHTAMVYFPPPRPPEVDTSKIPDGRKEFQQLKNGSVSLSYDKWSWRRNSPYYSKHPLDLYQLSEDDDNPSHCLGKGSVISVQEGQIYPIEVLISEIPGGGFSQALFIEQLDDNGKPLDSDHELFTLFRTTVQLPVKMSDDFDTREGRNRNQSNRYALPKYKPYGPVWKVVRSTASGGGSGTGTASQSLLGNRNAPRTARVNENDDDLSL